MNMVTRYIIISIAAFALFGRAETVDDVVLADLSQKGMQPGFDDRTGEVVAVGKSTVQIGEIASYPRLAALRDRCYKVASLEARGKILQVLEQSLTAGRRSEFQHDGVSASLELATLSKVFSERVLTGWHIAASAEEYSKGLYSVAVAVSWSHGSEEKLKALKAGQLVPSDKWKDELLAHIKGQNLSNWADVRLFVDSKGFPHVLGIGLSDWDGNSRTQGAAILKADMFAQKNLMLGLYGDAAVMEAAGKWRREVFSKSDSEVSELRFYESLSEIKVRDALPEGCGPFHMASIKNPVNGRKEFVSIYSFEPPVAIDVGGQFVSGTAESVTNDTQSSGVMIWNPNTGKYEKR